MSKLTTPNKPMQLKLFPFYRSLSRIYISHIATLSGGPESGPSTSDTAQITHAFASIDLPFSSEEGTPSTHACEDTHTMSLLLFLSVSDILKVATENGRELGETERELERTSWGVFCVCCVELAAQKQEQAYPQPKRQRHWYTPTSHTPQNY